MFFRRIAVKTSPKQARLERAVIWTAELMNMRTGAKPVGIAGVVLALIGATAALIVGGADPVIVGGWITVAAAVAGIVGGVVVGTRPGWAALVVALSAVAAGLVAPGVISAIADMTVVFLAYLAATLFFWSSGQYSLSSGEEGCDRKAGWVKLLTSTPRSSR